MQRRGRAASSAQEELAFSHLGLSPFQAARHAGSLLFSQLLPSPGIPSLLPWPSKAYGRELRTEKSLWPVCVIYKRRKLDSSHCGWIWIKAEYQFVTSSGLEVRVSQMQQHRSLWVLLVTQVVVG